MITSDDDYVASQKNSKRFIIWFCKPRVKLTIMRRCFVVLVCDWRLDVALSTDLRGRFRVSVRGIICNISDKVGNGRCVIFISLSGISVRENQNFYVTDKNSRSRLFWEENISDTTNRKVIYWGWRCVMIMANILVTSLRVECVKEKKNLKVPRTYFELTFTRLSHFTLDFNKLNQD